MTLSVIDPLDPPPPVCRDGESVLVVESGFADRRVIEVESGAISLSREQFPEMAEDPIVRVPDGEDTQETAEYVYDPAVTPAIVASLARTGGKKADELKGGAGHDWLDGRFGNDKLTGGAGRDTFAFTTKLGPGNVDWIVDFKHADDTITLAKTVFGNIRKGALSKDAFWTGAHAHDRSDRIIYNSKTGALSYDADGSETKYDPIRFAQLKPMTLLKADDFFVV